MFKILAEKTYSAILLSEIGFIRYYKLNPYEMFDKMSITDFQYVMRTLEKQNEEERKDKQTDKLMKCLTAVRDMLNYMFLPER